MTTNAQLTATGPARILGFRLNALNRPVYRVTPLADGWEHVEHLCNSARPGTTPAEFGIDAAEVVWADGYAAHLRIRIGVHRSRTAATPEQAELAARCAAQGYGTPELGATWVVAETTGYQLIQNRPLEHRDCHCGNGTTTYAEGTVVDRTFWADNSIDVVVELADGTTRRVQTKAPSGDACY